MFPTLTSPRTRTWRTRDALGRAAVIGTVLAAVTGTLAGCSSSSPDSGGKVTLTMWQQWGGGHERQVLDELIKKYEALNPNVTIVETPVTNNAKILASITGGNAPDIVSLGNSLSLGTWASVGAITDLTPYIDASKLDTSVFVKSAYDGMRAGDKTYALPFQVFSAGLIYNKKLFAEAGLTPPTTLEELAQDAKALTKTSSDGAITQLGFTPSYPGPDQGQTCPLISYAYAFGGAWADQAGKATPNTKENVAALTWMKQVYDAAGGQKVTNFVSSAGSYLTGGDPLESGKLAMMFDGPWSIQYAKDNAPAVAADLAVVPLPASETSPSSAGSTYIDANPQFIPKGSKNAQAAFDFIKWETTTAAETSTFSNAVANIPQLKDVPHFALLDDANYKEFVTIANAGGARSWVQTATSSTYGTNLCQAQDAVLLNGADPADALAGVKTQ